MRILKRFYAIGLSYFSETKVVEYSGTPSALSKPRDPVISELFTFDIWLEAAGSPMLVLETILRFGNGLGCFFRVHSAQKWARHPYPMKFLP